MVIALAAALFVGTAVFLAVPDISAVRVRSLDPTRSGSWSGHRTAPVLRSLRKRRQDSQRRLVHALRALASELNAGSAPLVALERTAGEPPLWPRALAAARFGESVHHGLLQDAKADQRLASQLRQLAACWRVGIAHGAGLASSVERLALSVQSQFELRDLLDSEMAAPRATARMLSLLPVVGIAMGYLLGADPLRWFLGSQIGVVVLAGALALTVAGALWTRRIVRRVDDVAALG